MSRLCIYMVYDKQNVINPYIGKVLEELVKHVSSMVVVCNFGEIKAGREIIESYADKIVLRKNNGLDAGAFKEVMTQVIGWDMIYEYDELLLTNDTYFGPLYSFDDMFATMNADVCDFWGITKHPEVTIEGIGDYGEHIQSYFLNFKSAILHSHIFREYWENYIPSNVKEETIVNYEIGLNSLLNENGFVGSTYMDKHNEKYIFKSGENPYSQYALEIIRDLKVPIIKKTNFYGKNRWLINTLLAKEYIYRNLEYDCELIDEYFKEYQKKGLVGTYYNFDEMLEFVSKKNKIYIYGYGIWGHITADYFDYKGWKYEGFVTSDGIDEKAKRFNDIVLSEDDGIIIAQEYKHVCEQIINYMGERCNKEQIFTPCYV